MSIRFVHNLLLQVSRSDGYERNNFFALKLSTPRQHRLGKVVPNGVNALYTYKALYTQPFSPVTHAHTYALVHTHTHTHTHTHAHIDTHTGTYTQTQTQAQTHKQIDTHTHVDTHARAHTHTCMQTYLCVCLCVLYVCV